MHVGSRVHLFTTFVCQTDRQRLVLHGSGEATCEFLQVAHILLRLLLNGFTLKHLNSSYVLHGFSKNV